LQNQEGVGALDPQRPCHQVDLVAGLLKARDAVATETPAIFATSESVGLILVVPVAKIDLDTTNTQPKRFKLAKILISHLDQQKVAIWS
jgi:hypothetical protein